MSEYRISIVSKDSELINQLKLHSSIILLMKIAKGENK